MPWPDNVASLRCRCGSGRLYKRCCLPLHEWQQPRSAEALMRARYAAYAYGLDDFIIETTDKLGPQWKGDTLFWKGEIRRFYEETRFLKLDVLESHEDGDHATVRFFAHLQSGPRDASFGETSTFVRQGGWWKYHGALEQTRKSA